MDTLVFWQLLFQQHVGPANAATFGMVRGQGVSWQLDLQHGKSCQGRRRRLLQFRKFEGCANLSAGTIASGRVVNPARAP